MLKRGPDVRAAAKSGEPAMTSLRPTIPVSVPVPAEAGAGFSGDVTATTVQDSTTLDTKPDARGPRPAPTSGRTAARAGASAGRTNGCDRYRVPHPADRNGCPAAEATKAVVEVPAAEQQERPEEEEQEQEEEMTRILLADDSPHAQRMGERILREEGFEVVTVTDGQTALMRLADVDPDVVFADVSLPRRPAMTFAARSSSARVTSMFGSF